MLLNGTTPVSLTGATLTYNPTHAHSDVEPQCALNLVDGNYDLHLLGTGVTDAAGNTLGLTGNDALAGYADVSFFKLAGDSNGDRIVNATDTQSLVRRAL